MKKTKNKTNTNNNKKNKQKNKQKNNNKKQTNNNNKKTNKQKKKKKKKKNVATDMYAHRKWGYLRNLNIVVNVRMKKLCSLGYAKCAKWRLWLYCLNTQADLNLCWALMPEGTFSDVVADMLPYLLEPVAG